MVARGCLGEYFSLTDENENAAASQGEALPPPTSQGIPPGARRIAALAGLLMIPTLVGGFQLSGIAGVVGVAAGGLLALANFWIVARIVVKLTSGEEVAPAILIGRLFAKFIGLGAAVGVLVMVVEVDPIGLVLGLSVVVAAVIAASVLSWVI